MNNRCAVVTGGAGFIGSHLVDELLRAGFKVTALDNLSTGSVANLSNAFSFGEAFSLVECDIANSEIEEILKDLSPEVLFHLAAQADVRQSLLDPIGDATVNILGTLNVAESARNVGVGKIVYAASGGTLYGEPNVDLLPINEDVAHTPLSFYGVSKKAAIDYLKAQSALYGMNYVALALANVYGPRQDPHGESGVVSIFIGNIAAGKQCVIYGDGQQTRDFVYVGDVVKAFLRASNCQDNGIFNIGSSKETSVIELYDVISALMGDGDRPKFLSVRNGEIMRSSLSNEKAKEILGWRPETDLRSGLSSVIDWVNSGKVV